MGSDPRTAIERSSCHRSSHRASDPKPECHLDSAIAMYSALVADPWRSYLADVYALHRH